MLRHCKFLDWYSDAAMSKALCCLGIPGAGKTVIAYVDTFLCNSAEFNELHGRSLVIDELSDRSRHAGGSGIGLAYVYCDYRDQSHQTTVNIVGGLLKQLLSTLPRLPEDIIRLYEQKCHRERKLFELTERRDSTSLGLLCLQSNIYLSRCAR